MAKRHELTDAAWAVLEPLLPQTSKGHPWKDHRPVINGILWVLATGTAWRDVPNGMVPGRRSTIASTAGEETARGIASWPRCSPRCTARARSTGISGASTAPPSGRFKQPRGRGKKSAAEEPTSHALGRSRGGFGSKLHLLCDSHGIITAFRVTAGNINECTEAIPLLESVSLSGRSRPRSLAGDKGYSTRAIRAWCRRHHMKAIIPERVDQIEQRSHRPGRRLSFDRQQYRRRNVIERAVGWMKHLRRIAMRSEKLALNYEAMFTVALIARYATVYLSDTT
jgi:transposase